MRTLDQPVPSRAPRWSWWLAPIIGGGAGLPWLTAALSGNLSIPHMDGWAYSRIAAEFARTGHIHLLGWGQMSLVGLVAMLGPLGRWLTVQQTAISLLTAVALYCTYDLLRFELDRRRALFATAIFACWPGLAELSVSFMSDIPALAGSLACLTLGAHALRRDSRRLACAALLVGFWAFTVREQTLAAPIAMVAYGVATSARRRRLSARWLTGAALTFMALMVVFVFWHASLPHGQSIGVTPSPKQVLDSVSRQIPLGYFTVAFCIFPAMLAGAPTVRWGRWGALFAALAVAVAIICVARHGTLLLGDIFTVWGAHPNTNQNLIFGTLGAKTIDLVAIVSGALLAGALVDRLRTAGPLLSIFTAVSFATVLLTALADHQVYDRYLLALGPWLLVVALGREQAPQRGERTVGAPPAAEQQASWRLAVPALALLAVVAAAVGANAFSSDRAHWNISKRLVADGVPATRIDNEIWDGWASPQGVVRSVRTAGDPAYAQVESGLPCVVVEGLPLTRIGPAVAWFDLGIAGSDRSVKLWTLRSVQHYRTFLIAGRSTIYVYDTHAPGC